VIAMALLRCDFRSEVLRMDTSMTVLLPQDLRTPFSVEPADVDPAPPLLYLLHGGGDDSTAWVRKTSLPRYAETAGLAVVMPQVGRSYYADQMHGQRYWTFVTHELPDVVQSLVRVTTRADQTFVAGISMGGYAAVKWALHEPDRFGAVGSLSGVLDIARVRNLRELDREPMMQATFGETDLTGTEHDLFHLLGRRPGPLPAVYLGCGTDDPFHRDSVRFASAATDAGVPVTTAFRPGTHGWDYWDVAVRDLLAWLPVHGRPGAWHA
jgi:putative tributyrin esterase